MKFKLLSVAVFVALLLMVLAAAVLAQEEIEVPPPYAGLENPFSWDDASAQEAGKVIFQESCAVCHVATPEIPTLGVDFSAVDYRQMLEERPDFYFWTVSEGRLDKGMLPWEPFRSEEERWQVLTYIWSLGGEVPPPTPPPPPEIEEGTLLLTVPERAQAGQPLTMTATFQDSQGQPVAGATVKFFIQMDFFASSLMEIGKAATDEQGVAVLEYTSRQTGDIQVVARYQGDGFKAAETTAMVSLAEADEPFYQAEAGFVFPALGEEVFIGPKSALEPDGAAPTSAFRLPGGILSWLLIVVAAMVLVWATYFRVMYQVFRIPIVSEIGDTNTRLVPMIGMIIVVALGFLLVLMPLTGPYTHLHLLR